jgi:hypothetical protein
MKLKIDLDKFDPDRSHQDASRWFARYELFIGVQGSLELKDEELASNCLRYLPLFLAGSALLCYEELPTAERASYEIVKARLTAFYELDASQAFDRLCTSKYSGEGVDVFVAQLRRYTNLLELPRESADKLIVEQFLRAIPAAAARELRVLSRGVGKTLDLNTVLTNARHLSTLQLDDQGEMIGLVKEAQAPRIEQRRESAHDQRQERVPGRGRGKGKTSTQKPPSCFVCEGAHYARECPLIQKLRMGNEPGSSAGQATKASPPGLAYPR